MSIRKRIENYVKNAINSALSVNSCLVETKVLTGTLLAEIQKGRVDITGIEAAEFKVFSQFGEDGIIQFLVNKLKIPRQNQSFVEFGVENYTEANTIFLMMKDNWRGLIIDGSSKNIESIKGRSHYWRHELSAVNAFIHKENINDLLSEAGFSGEIGLLSVDIDGNDFWIWKALTVCSPWIVIAEYNSVFGNEHAISVPYDAAFERTKAHHSNLYWGCSIRALEHLASEKGYTLVGSNAAGNNAFFVRNDKIADLTPVLSKTAWVESRFRESRDEAGKLTFLAGRARSEAIAGMMVVDVVDGQLHRFGDLRLQ